MNLNIRIFEDSLIEVCNASDIPIEAKRLALRDVLRIVEEKAVQVIGQEIEMQKEKNEDGDSKCPGI